MSERVLSGTPASPGSGLGTAWALAPAVDASEVVQVDRREAELQLALDALTAAAESLSALAAGLTSEDAEIVATGALIAQDPALIAAIESSIRNRGACAPAAIVKAADEQAEQIATVGDEMLAARADDVRSIGRRAAALAAGGEPAAPPGSDLILIAHDLGPADVAELAPALAGIALAAGGPTAHAAIVARSLGLPMVTGLYEQLTEVGGGARLVIDGAAGALIVSPTEERARAARLEMGARRAAADRAHELRHTPAVTTDGTRVAVLVNAASPEELELGLRAGAEGIGLLRTELAFLDARDWPTEQQHTDSLASTLAGLGGRSAIVRVLDFGVDKSPPFLRDVPQRGVELLLEHPDALVAQLRALVLAAESYDVRVLLPMVDGPGQVDRVRALIEAVAAQLGGTRSPRLGSMIETPAAADSAESIARRSDFLSIGTNDLTAATLGADRFASGGAQAHHPLVLRSIAASVNAARAARIPIEVCGEAASDPIMLPLLIGLGIEELSVGAARVGPVRDWIRQLDARAAASLARSALTMDDAREVEWALRPLTIEHVLAR